MSKKNRCLWSIAAFAVTTLVLSGCISPIKVRKGTIGSEEVDGVPFYLPVRESRRFKLTKLKNPDGTYTRRCEQIEGIEHAVVPDYSELYLIRHRDFFFGSNTLGVELKDGILASVNSVRDPQVDETLAALTGVAKEAAAIAAMGAADVEVAPVPGEVLPDCNDGKRILAD